MRRCLLCRSAEWSAGVAGAVQFSTVCLEVEGSLQNPQKIKRTVQVLACVSAGTSAKIEPLWFSSIFWKVFFFFCAFGLRVNAPLAELSSCSSVFLCCFGRQVQTRRSRPPGHAVHLPEEADHRVPAVSRLRQDADSVSQRGLCDGAAGAPHALPPHHPADR